MFKFKFLKKKSVDKPSATQQKEAAAKKVVAEKLAHIEVHGMPEKFKKGMPASASSTKKVGLIIIGAGAVIIIVAGVFLIRYIFYNDQAPQQVTRESVEEVEEESIQVLSDRQAGSDEADQEEETAEEELDCGSISGLATADNVFINYENNQELSCLGERILDNCQKTKAIIETVDGDLEISILGLRQNNCIVQLDYPIDFLNLEEGTAEYAGTYLQCNYNINELAGLNYRPGRLAQYIYSQNIVNNLDDDTTCVGSAVPVWREQQLAKLAAEEEIELVVGLDSDNDGLTDVEEITIYNTDISSSDSDDDGYDDVAELENFYNPAGEGRLWESNLISEYIDDNYQLFYPQAWRLEDNSDGQLVHFFSETNGFVQLLVEDNSNGDSLQSWYADLVDSSIDLVNQEMTLSNNRIEILRSVDGLTAYLMEQGGGNKIYVLNYSPEGSETLEFMTTFEIMIQSFKKN